MPGMNSKNIHEKYTWIKTEIPLIEQIRDALKGEKYPLFVSEGTWKEKLDAIQHSNAVCEF